MSRVIGYIREAYIAYAFGAAGKPTPTSPPSLLPDWLNYNVPEARLPSHSFLFYIRAFSRKNAMTTRTATFSVVITVMTTMMIIGTALAEIFTEPFVRWMFRGFWPAQA